MKKITILLLAFAIVSGNAKAQKKWRIGFTLSPVLSKSVYSDDYMANYPEASSKIGLGISSGVDFYRLYGNHLMFKTGIQYNLKRFQVHHPVSNEGYVDFYRNLSFMILPFAFQYNFKIKQHRLFANTGVNLSWLYKSVDKTDTETYTNQYISWYPETELFLGIGYMYKIKDKYTFFINPEYSPKIFTDDYSTFRLNFGVIFNY